MTSNYVGIGSPCIIVLYKNNHGHPCIIVLYVFLYNTVLFCILYFPTLKEPRGRRVKTYWGTFWCLLRASRSLCTRCVRIAPEVPLVDSTTVSRPLAGLRSTEQVCSHVEGIYKVDSVPRMQQVGCMRITKIPKHNTYLPQ